MNTNSRIEAHNEFVSEKNLFLVKRALVDHLQTKHNMEIQNEEEIDQVINSEITNILEDNVNENAELIDLNYLLLDKLDTIFKPKPNSEEKKFYNIVEKDTEITNTINHIIEHPKEINESAVDVDINSGDRNDLSQTINKPFSFSVSLDAGNFETGINANAKLNNVCHINVQHVVLPNFHEEITYSLDKYSHIYMSIDELNGKFISSNKMGQLAIVKLIKQSDWTESTNSQIKYNVYSSSNGADENIGWKSKNSIGNLDKLTVNFYSPNGKLLKNKNDVVEIDSISESTDSFTINLSSHFEPGSFSADNRVDFQFLTLNTDGIVKDYLQNNDFTIDTVPDNSTLTIKKIPIAFDASGTPSYTQFGTTGNIAANGHCLNASNQSSITLKAITKEYIDIKTKKLV